jgi:L-threonylcarbamoyladenylate synthase
MFFSMEDPSGQDRARDLLLEGGVVALPTDTVWGLACLSDRRKSVERVFEIKARPRDASLPLFVARTEQIWDFADPDKFPAELAGRILDRFSPGPLTIVLPVRKGALGEHIVHSDGTAAFRIPDFTALRNLLDKLPAPLAATSLNHHGHSPIRGLRMVCREFESVLDAILVHPSPPLNQRVSTVMGFANGEITVFREGSVTATDLERALS